MLNTTIVPGGTPAKPCRPTSGCVEVCNSTYGNTGWIGVAQIWVSGTYITQGVVKMNDTYFNTSKYNTTAWRSLGMCQEVGHTLGRDHQDENFHTPPDLVVHSCSQRMRGSFSLDFPLLHDMQS